MSAADVQTLRDWLEVYEADAHVLETLDRLAAENERLRAALQPFSATCCVHKGTSEAQLKEAEELCVYCRARAALAGGVGDTA
jgi:aspartate aminotransferase-like enzyme